MRVAILNITAGGLSEGYKKYINEIVPLLVSHPKVDALLIAVPETRELYHLQTRFERVTWINYVPSRFFKLLPNDVSTNISSFNPDVVFIPTARTFRIDHIPTVTMVRNMETFAYKGPNPLTERMIIFLRWFAAKRAIRSADRIIAVSDFVKRHLISRYGVPESDIGVVYHGVDKIPRSEKPHSIPPGWEHRFLFAAGSIRPYRGLEDLIRSFGRLSPECRIQYRGVVIAGATSRIMTNYVDKLRSEAQQLGIAPNIHWVGNLNENQMSWCFSNCSAFVMTSRVEACPNVALEAMAHGCLVISTRNDPMPEFFLNNALYYSTGNYNELARLLEDALRLAPTEKVSMQSSLFGRAKKFSWEATVEGTVRELNQAVENGPRT